ncbi:F-box/FBD/LRR-repeat protein At1g13570-like [Vigna umbellata]|uniref:F-box/FBD/LRR-repeat protein At1g13570-like n=1 Tax=Vigna umbellata TaxID=87088 RepID=UPI001F5FDF59|nr:F-box/FBD/LRR-repeat protein At1g13570-like [Vigna umbellata]
MVDVMGPDLISDLPQSIIESILVQLPIRDAVRTSILSSKWRYKWASITQLVFDDKCVPPFSNDREVVERSVVKFITRALFLHQGPIHKFQISNSMLQSCPEIDQWILFLSRNDIKVLVMELGEGEFFRIPSSLFNCRKLTRLELSRCELDPPHSFKGFVCLRSLNLHQVLISPDAVESLISRCPLLESLSLSYFDNLALTISAPNLKYLYLEGEFKDICLEDTPLLVEISIAMYMTDDIAEHFEQSSNCNFLKFLGGVPNLEKLVGLIYFTKYLSIGIDSVHLPIMYHNLETIELYQVNFEDTKEILVILRMITSSPNLKELHISGSSNIPIAADAPDLDFWEKGSLSDSALNKLKTVKLSEMGGWPHEIEFIKYLLCRSPVLETLSIIPCVFDMGNNLKMLIELVKCRRASSRGEVIFIHE